MRGAHPIPLDHTGISMNIRAGDYVRLLARERPFVDDSTGWWKVVAVGDIDFDAIYEPLNIARRGIGFSSVTAHRAPDTPEAAA